MKDATDTDGMISALADEAGRPKPDALPFSRALPLGFFVGLAAALAVVVGVIGVRRDLFGILGTGTYAFKLAVTLLLAGGLAIVVRHMARPGSSARALLALAPGLLLLLAGALFDTTGFPFLGARAVSVPVCLAAIMLAAAPALVIVLAAMKRGIPTKLTRAGAAAGALAGALGAAAYTLACVNDGALFVAVWYGVAIIAMAGVGAVLGRWVLRW